MLESSNKFNKPVNTVIAPEKPFVSGGTPSPESNNEKPSNKNSRRNKIVAGVAGLALLGGGIFTGVNLANNGEKPPIATETSAPANPTEEAPVDSDVWYETLNVTPTAEDIVIDASTVTPEELPGVFNDRLTIWLNSGYTPAFAEGITEDENFKETAANVASQYDQLFEENMIATEHSTDIDQLLLNIADGHRFTIFVAARTSFPEQSRLDKVPYMTGERLESVQDLYVTDDGSVIFVMNSTEYNNSDENSANEDPKITADFSEKSITQRVTFVVENDQYKLADIQTL